MEGVLASHRAPYEPKPKEHNLHHLGSGNCSLELVINNFMSIFKGSTGKQSTFSEITCWVAIHDSTSTKG